MISAFMNGYAYNDANHVIECMFVYIYICLLDVYIRVLYMICVHIYNACMLIFLFTIVIVISVRRAQGFGSSNFS